MFVSVPRLSIPEVLGQGDYRVLVVDDDSPDGTGAVADALAREHPGRVEVLHRRGRRGLGRSYVDAFRRVLASDADLVCQMDADLSHGPSYLPALVAAAGTFDVVIGSRYLHGVSVVNWPLHRIALSAAANRYVRAITGAPVADCTSGCTPSAPSTGCRASAAASSSWRPGRTRSRRSKRSRDADTQTG